MNRPLSIRTVLLILCAALLCACLPPAAAAPDYGDVWVHTWTLVAPWNPGSLA